jgi:[ribosomal protein S5]-alanine N-acetyltransferase
VEALPRTELTDGTVRLRPWRLDDVPRVTEACQDPEIPGWTAVIPDPYTEDDARAWIEQTIRDWDARTEAAFAVTDAETGEVLGAIGLNLQEHYALQASIGYWVAKEARGRGVATAALRLVARWGLRDLGLPRVQLLTDPENVPSQRVAENVGFRREGLLRSYIEARGRGRRDCLMFSLLAGELDGDDRG